jgi:hypothetical protein
MTSMVTKINQVAGCTTRRKSPRLPAPSDVGDGLTPGELVMRAAVMKALDGAEQRTLDALADPHPLVATEREKAIREIADLVMRTAAKVIQVEVRSTRTLR